jgi:protein-disulfide isomerase
MSENPSTGENLPSTQPEEAHGWGSGENPAEAAKEDVFYGADEDTITFKRSHIYSVMIPLAFVVGLSVGFILWGRASGSQRAVAAAGTSSSGAQANSSGSGNSSQVAQANPTSIPRYDIPLDDDPRLGPDNAAITIVEFSDYECPYCRKFHSEVFHQLMDDYPDQIQFVYRDFPLTSIHPNAFDAAMAANCAGEQDVYWQYHDLLFGASLGLSAEAYTSYASQLDLDTTAFKQCLNTKKYQDEIQSDYDFAAQLGIRSTPTFFINGIPIVGAQPLEIFRSVIDKELAGELN